MAKQLRICFVDGQQFEVYLGDGETVQQLRELVEKQKGELPPATTLKLLQGSRVLLDDLPCRELKQEEMILAVVSRETRVEILLHASGHCSLYKDALSAASQDGNSTSVVGPFPTILEVLQEMSGEALSMEHLKPGTSKGWLEFYGCEGELLLPGLDAGPLLAAVGHAGPLAAVTLSVGVNSDAFNQGLGVVVEAYTLIDVPSDFSDVAEYMYNGFGLQKNEGRRRNAVKFHPGMNMGQFRVEGVGGFHNSSLGFTPKNFSSADGALHTLELTLGADGVNTVRIRGSDDGQDWQRQWKNMLFDGLHVPALYAWLDLGSQDRPLHVGPITLQGHFDTSHMRTVEPLEAAACSISSD